MHLHCKLYSLRKSALSMRDYLSQIKEVSDTLATFGSPISDIEHIAIILNGLPQDYDSFVAIITSSHEPYTFDCVTIILLNVESRFHDPLYLLLSINTAQVTTPTPTDFVSTSRFRPNTLGPSTFPGHDHLTTIMAEAGPHRVYNANLTVSNSGAFDHVTNNLANLSTHSPYTGSGKFGSLPPSPLPMIPASPSTIISHSNDREDPSDVIIQSLPSPYETPLDPSLANDNTSEDTDTTNNFPPPICTP
ncbi:hypothetical protein J1N35_036916 [Gossypium stocksii]|uniref:Retrovirus-related Pol polyprotein from transposon TNT 1-94 n=1 Tax=Gossypium stocksii TaxID=47602 RepID=A0A9D3UJ20_9ROSI|nr:hypothetical protein J1N35_036916 [Gossypium stocksii]